MIRFSWDTETFPIRPGRQAPRIVCVQVRHDGSDSLELREAGLDRLERALKTPGILFIGHRIAYDVVCSIAARPRLLPLWLAAYAADRVTCTYEREKLVRIAEGSLARYHSNGLLDLVKRYKIQAAYKDGDKNSPDAWRTRYCELDGIPVAEWPEDASRYALADLSVDDVYLAQDTAPAAWLVDQFRQARGALWQALTSAGGMRTDPRAVHALAEQIEAEHEVVRELLTTGADAALDRWIEVWNDAHPDAVEAGKPMTRAWVKVPYHGGLVRPIGTKDTKAAAARMKAVCAHPEKRLAVAITKTGKERLAKKEITAEEAADQYVSLEADATAVTGDPVLIAYSRYVSISTLRSRVERLRMAAEAGLPIQARYDNLKETGRTSTSKGDSEPGKPLAAFGDQVQNLHRAPGLRECYTARPGCVLISVDWRAAELHTLAQTCLDLGLSSNLAKVLNSGRDVHTWFGCQIKGWDYEWASAGGVDKKALKAARQAAKAANFGYPGGLGIEKFRMYSAKTYQVFFTDDEAKALKAQWLDAFPEMVGYFAFISHLVDSGQPLIHHQSGRYRGDIRYTSAANSYFQGRAADMAKDAGWRLTEAIYGPEQLPCRIWAFCHDEFIVEAPESEAHRVAARVVEIMEDAGRTWCPGAPVKAEPAMSRIWRKGAEPTLDAAGRLIPWEDRPMGEVEIEKARKFLAQGRTTLYTSWVLGRSEEQISRAVA